MEANKKAIMELFVRCTKEDVTLNNLVTRSRILAIQVGISILYVRSLILRLNLLLHPRNIKLPATSPSTKKTDSPKEKKKSKGDKSKKSKKDDGRNDEPARALKKPRSKK